MKALAPIVHFVSGVVNVLGGVLPFHVTSVLPMMHVHMHLQPNPSPLLPVASMHATDQGRLVFESTGFKTSGTHTHTSCMV